MHIDKCTILKALLASEDTNNSKTITVDDKGPKSFDLSSLDGKVTTIKGTYYLANLLQEIWLNDGKIDINKVKMAPIERVNYLMQNYYWDMLTRRLDEAQIVAALVDDKRSSEKSYLYVPKNDEEGLTYYKKITQPYPQIEIIPLDYPLTEEMLHKIDEQPGLLALKYNAKDGEALPYVVPGGRFNEMYGWDSYFIGLGLMAHDKFELTKAMIENLAYQIHYYGKMLNANRSYYLTRSQPPLYTPLLVEFYKRYRDRLSEDWLTEHLTIALDEYYHVWMNPKTHYFADIHLNHYFDEGWGRPKETEAGHFQKIMTQYAKIHGLSVDEFTQLYDRGDILDRDLDTYFQHDRAMRESGHDTTTRLNGVCADSACVDLNSILHRTELDIADLLTAHYKDGFMYKGNLVTEGVFIQYAQKRQAAMLQYLWNDEKGSFFDYHVGTQEQSTVISASNFFSLWANVATAEQAERMVSKYFPMLLHKGGIASTVPLEVNDSEPERQWDYPYGWAPHQILLWAGLEQYGYIEDMQEAAFRWVNMIMQATISYNGLIPEKYNVVTGDFRTNVEYGNVGTEFEYLPQGGFGWTNASLVLGLSKISTQQQANINQLADRIL